jgi:autotransporter translocation and assembly factor TamB
MRRFLRWTAIAVASLVGLVILAVIVLVAVLHTDWGREKVRQQAEKVLDGAVQGDVALGPIEGDLLSKFTIAGLEVRDPGGHVAVRASRVLVDYDLLSLVRRSFTAESVEVHRPIVIGRLDEKGELNLTKLLAPQPEKQGQPWLIRVESLRVTDGLFVIPTATQTFSFARADVDARVEVGALAKRIDVARAAAVWIQRGIPLEVHGSVVTSEPLVALAGLEVIAGDSRVALPLAMLRPKAQGGVAALEAALKEADLFHFWPHAFALGDVKLGGAVVRAGREQPVDARLAVEALKGTIAIAAKGNPEIPAASGRIVARGVVSPLPAAPGKVDLDLAFDAAGRSAQTLKGTVDLGASGVVAGRVIESLKVAAVAGGGVARIDLTAVVPTAQATAHADVRLTRPLVLEQLEAKLSAMDIGAAASQRNLDGQADLELRARGPIDDLTASGTLELRRLRAGTARVRRADASFALAGLPRAPRGTVDVTARNVTAGKDRFGDVRVRASATSPRLFDVRVVQGGPGSPYAVRGGARVSLEDKGTRIHLRDLVATVRGLEVRGRGGELLFKKGGGYAARDLAFRSAAGAVEIEGDLAPPQAGPRTRRFSLPTGKLHFHAHALDLARLRDAFAPTSPEIAGKLSTDLHVVREGRQLGFEGELLARGVVVRPNTPALDATARVNLGERKLVAFGHVRARASRGERTVGVLDYAVSARAPSNVTDAAAWRRLDVEESIDHLRVALRDVDVATVGALAGRRDLGGRIDATLEARPDDRSLVLNVSFTDLAFPRFTDLDVTADGTWTRETFTLEAKASMNGVHALDAKARLQAGLSQLLSGIDVKRVPLAASVDIARLELAKLERSFPIGAKVGGVLSGKARLDGTAARPIATADLRLDDARMGEVRFRAVTAEGRLDENRVAGRVAAQQDAGGTLEASGTIDRRKDNAVAARLQARRFDLGFLAVLAARRTDSLAGAGGQLDADVAFNAARGSRSANGRLAITRGQIYTPTSGLVTGIEIAARITEGQLVLEKLQGRGSTGTVKGEGSAVLVGLVPASFRGRVVANDFPVTAGSMVVQVDTDGEITGRGDEDAWEMTATLRGTNVRLPEQRREGEELQKVGDLEDVVYTDVPGFERRTGLLALTGSEEVGDAGGRELRLVLRTPGGITVSGKEADLLLNQNLTVLVRDGQSYVGGGVNVNRGFIELFGRRYDVVRANASFNENELPNPRLDIRLAHEFRTTTLFIDVSGTLRNPELRLSAEPGAYDQAQLIGWVLGGDPDEPVTDQPLDARAVGLASNLVLGQVQNLVRRALPVDVLAVRVGEGSDTQTTRFEVGKWLTEDLFLGYVYRMNAPEERNLNEAQIEYRLGRRWLLEAFFGDRGVAGADILWSKKY